ncbi:MAG: acyl-CoA dehydrogenase family protein [Planctomycetia bacterium]|nr:acyl-CoA dehydrogenase family protein [Planctomycetia bacterium]
MAQTAREKQMAEAEELLGDSLARVGFVKGLFFGRHLAARLAAYPKFRAADAVGQQAAELRSFCDRAIDAAAIDREARIPDQVIRGLGDLGVLGACLPLESGGRGLSQSSYCRLIEVLGHHCGSTALFVNAHHSIGPRAIVLFGNEEQKTKWLPKLATGEWLSAFALTEPEAGSDAGNVQTTATPTPDGRGYVLNGEKRWITNGGVASVLTVMARTPAGKGKETKVTAFLVTPDMPGFQVVEERMSKLGVRGTATSRLAFREMFVPKENVLGQLGKGLKVALTVLDFGRTTFGASCAGAAKKCLELASAHAAQRVQFGETLDSFELVRHKLANMAAGIYGIESATYQTAALIDSGDDDYMIETALLKVFSTEVLWTIVNDAFQIYGGKAYFTDQPLERMLRDARINQIGEGANDVLRVFSALVGMRDVGLELKGVVDALLNPLGNLTRLGGFASRRLGSMLAAPPVEVRAAELREDAEQLGALIGRFGGQVEKLLRKYQEGIVDQQLQLARIADAAAELYVSSCVLNRLDAELCHDPHDGHATPPDLSLGRLFLTMSRRRTLGCLAALWENDDDGVMGYKV